MSNHPNLSLNLEINSSKSKTNANSFFPIRYYIAFLGFLSSAIMFAVRCNLSVAIVAMVDNDDRIVLSVNQTNDNITSELKVEPYNKVRFTWSGEEQGIVLGSYYYGYALVQIISGLLADKYDPVHLAVGTHTLASLLTLLTPYAASNGIISLAIVRGLLGLSHISLPLCLMQAGSNIGIALVMPLTAIMCESITLGGWSSAFYFIGLINLILPIIWIKTVTTDPSDHPWISEAEKQLLAHSKRNSKAKVKIHWIKIFTSTALWSLVLSRTGQSLFYMIITTKIPAYFESVLGIGLYRNGIFNSFLYLAIAFSQLISGPSAKYIIDKGFLGRTVTRKIFETQGKGSKIARNCDLLVFYFTLLIPCICLVIIPLIEPTSNTVMCLLVVSCFFMGFVCGGHMPIVSEMSPELSGTIFGITNFAASSMGFLAPLLIGVLLDHGDDKVYQWNLVFYASALFMLIVNIIFCIFATSQTQLWSSSDQDDSKIRANRSNLFVKTNLSSGSLAIEQFVRQSTNVRTDFSPNLHHKRLGSYFNFDQYYNLNRKVETTNNCECQKGNLNNQKL
ncbi:putative inorganic phosphate cotransporter [Tetranychus urticae]|uniref:putative inorganic phosphate cotransporter n=1 Tax=Tetranychus urticae TaxID=32264 RepID=UPI000D646A43|nr:putative inorganic phosphate cotransporter [Tetranychus urticae]